MSQANQINSDLLESVLNSSVGASETAFAVRKDRYQELVALGNVSSYSMQQLMYSCPRKFQLTKMQADCEAVTEKEVNVDFAFGHALGAGVAEYDESRNLKKSYWAAFLAWNIDLLARKQVERGDPKKSFAHVLWGLNLYAEFFLEEGLDEYEVLKIEATIGIDFENGHYYSGHIDELLRHKESGRMKVKENKSTGYASVDPALYANSDQTLGYSVVVSAHGATEYDVFYSIYSTTDQRWISMQFVKSPLAKAEWLQTQLLFGSELTEYEAVNFFPRRGGSCFEYSRRCKFFESCDFNAERVFSKQFKDLVKIGSLDELDAIEHIDYRFTLSELVAGQETSLQEESHTPQIYKSAAASNTGMETL